MERENVPNRRSQRKWLPRWDGKNTWSRAKALLKSLTCGRGFLFFCFFNIPATGREEISPTLFILYTADMPETPAYVLNIAYADDVTQVILQTEEQRKC